MPLRRRRCGYGSHERRRRANRRPAVLRDAAGIGIAVGAFGLSYGAIAVASGFTRAADLRAVGLMFTGASQFALVGVIGGGGSLRRGRAHRAPARRPQRALRAAALVAAAGARRAPRRRGAVRDRRERGDGLARGRPASGPPARPCSRAGTPAPPPARSAAGALRPARVRPRRRRPGRVPRPARAAADGALARRRLALTAAAAALIAVPLTPAGVPVLVAALCVAAAVMWAAILCAAGGCYLLKLAGLSVPRRVLETPRVERIADRLPIALLAALIAVSTFTDGSTLVLDERVAGSRRRASRCCCERRSSSWWGGVRDDGRAADRLNVTALGGSAGCRGDQRDALYPDSGDNLDGLVAQSRRLSPTNRSRSSPPTAGRGDIRAAPRPGNPHLYPVTLTFASACGSAPARAQGEWARRATGSPAAARRDRRTGSRAAPPGPVGPARCTGASQRGHASEPIATCRSCDGRRSSNWISTHRV